MTALPAPALTLALITALLTTAAAAEPSRQELRILSEASTVVDELVAAPDRGIPEELLRDAECIGVFPRVKKGALIVGGQHGRGVVSCRDESGRMGGPAFYSISAASLGYQIGGSSTDIVFLVMNRGGMEKLVSDRLTIGAEGSAAAGPVGRSAKASTEVQLQAQILSWSRSRGLFAGLSLEGPVLEPRENSNERLYGEPASARSILVRHEKTVPTAASAFVRTIRKHSAR